MSMSIAIAIVAVVVVGCKHQVQQGYRHVAARGPPVRMIVLVFTVTSNQ